MNKHLSDNWRITFMDGTWTEIRGINLMSYLSNRAVIKSIERV